MALRAILILQGYKFFPIIDTFIAQSYNNNSKKRRGSYLTNPRKRVRQIKKFPRMREFALGGRNAGNAPKGRRCNCVPRLVVACVALCPWFPYVKGDPINPESETRHDSIYWVYLCISSLLKYKYGHKWCPNPPHSF